MTPQESAGQAYETVLNRASGLASAAESSQQSRHKAFTALRYLESGRGPTGGFIPEVERNMVKSKLTEALKLLIERGHLDLDVPSAKACLKEVEEAVETGELEVLSIKAEKITKCFI